MRYQPSQKNLTFSQLFLRQSATHPYLILKLVCGSWYRRNAPHLRYRPSRSNVTFSHLLTRQSATHPYYLVFKIAPLTSSTATSSRTILNRSRRQSQLCHASTWDCALVRDIHLPLPRTQMDKLILVKTIKKCNCFYKDFVYLRQFKTTR